MPPWIRYRSTSIKFAEISWSARDLEKGVFWTIVARGLWPFYDQRMSYSCALWDFGWPLGESQVGKIVSQTVFQLGGGRFFDYLIRWESHHFFESSLTSATTSSGHARARQRVQIGQSVQVVWTSPLRMGTKSNIRHVSEESSVLVVLNLKFHETS